MKSPYKVGRSVRHSSAIGTIQKWMRGSDATLCQITLTLDRVYAV